MRHGKITKEAGQWLRRNPSVTSIAHTMLQAPKPGEIDGAYRLYNADTQGLRSEMTQDDLNKYLGILRQKQKGLY